MTFGTPSAPGAGGDEFAYKDHLGELVVIDVLAAKPGVVTSFGAADAISANVTVVKGPQPGATFKDALLFGAVAYNQIKDNVGERVLVRVAQGVAQPGKSAPWVLNTEVTAEDIAEAERVLVQASMGQAAPPAAGGYPQAPTGQAPPAPPAQPPVY